ncbi:hypothetical protein PCANC_22724 [Puccinia coronata f. sp. avenae]|uniref:Uncharacterized protein n=1 Tax=Puccinia coronata f. sp. avenae TaxID=200324 RepID=A0A2N5U9Q3_9BASI|nr:hypothetical protein PCANC_22724 [Puccinia coronata f. sp. avenae]PLW43600.1 hypothetical protein PCASD_11450 [Puccinia coronata f. sp. avenae]
MHAPPDYSSQLGTTIQGEPSEPTNEGFVSHAPHSEATSEHLQSLDGGLSEAITMTSGNQSLSDPASPQPTDTPIQLHPLPMAESSAATTRFVWSEAASLELLSYVNVVEPLWGRIELERDECLKGCLSLVAGRVMLTRIRVWTLKE